MGVFGSIAYVIQTSWIQSGTIYNDADIYLLDDPFSDLDAHTTTTLFNVSFQLVEIKWMLLVCPF